MPASGIAATNGGSGGCKSIASASGRVQGMPGIGRIGIHQIPSSRTNQPAHRSARVRQQNAHAAQTSVPGNGHARDEFFTVVKLLDITSASRYWPGSPHAAHGPPLPLRGISAPSDSQGSGDPAARQMMCDAFSTAQPGSFRTQDRSALQALSARQRRATNARLRWSRRRRVPSIRAPRRTCRQMARGRARSQR